MKNQAVKLGEDAVLLEKCMNATDHLATGVISLPYLAERAKYDNKISWRIEFAWGITKFECF